MPSPTISKNVRKSWFQTNDLTIINFFKDKNIEIELKNDNNRHFKIFGDKRTIDLYATTGTISSNKTKLGDKTLNYCSYKEMLPERAFDRIFSLATIGY